MNDLKKYTAEGIGTMFLVLLACGSAVLAGPSIGAMESEYASDWFLYASATALATYRAAMSIPQCRSAYI